MSNFPKEIFGYQLRETFRTHGSRSFDLISTGNNLGKGVIVGWIDIHYPCYDPIRIRVRASVPQRIVGGSETLIALGRLAIKLVDADPKEQFEVQIFSASNHASLSNRADAVETTRLFMPPPRSADEPQ